MFRDNRTPSRAEGGAAPFPDYLRAVKFHGIIRGRENAREKLTRSICRGRSSDSGDGGGGGGGGDWRW